VASRVEGDEIVIDISAIAQATKEIPQ